MTFERQPAIKPSRLDDQRYLPEVHLSFDIKIIRVVYTPKYTRIVYKTMRHHSDSASVKNKPTAWKLIIITTVGGATTATFCTPHSRIWISLGLYSYFYENT